MRLNLNIKYKIIIILLSIFVFVPQIRQAAAGGTTVSPSFCGQGCSSGAPVPCVTPGNTNITVTGVVNAIEQFLQMLIDDFLNMFYSVQIDLFVRELLETGINEILEMNFISSLESWWAYDYRPALQDMTGQLNTAMVDETRNLASFEDADLQQTRQTEFQDRLLERHRNTQPSEDMCVVGTLAGGFSRSNSFARAIRQASERDNSSNLSNSAGSRYEFGELQAIDYQWDRYCSFLADPQDNGGETGCGPLLSVTESRNADVEPTRFLFDNHTIDVTEPHFNAALEALKENLVNVTPPPRISPESLTGVEGRQEMLNKRSYIARKNAARSTIEYIASLRMPTVSAQNYANLINQVRTNANIPISNLNEKISYRELLHILSTEQFTSGRYNLDRIGQIRNAEREGLTLSVFYLMLLREKYEIMERGVMSLAIQTAIEIDRELSGSEGVTEGPSSN